MYSSFQHEDAFYSYEGFKFLSIKIHVLQIYWTFLPYIFRISWNTSFFNNFVVSGIEIYITYKRKRAIAMNDFFFDAFILKVKNQLHSPLSSQETINVNLSYGALLHVSFTNNRYCTRSFLCKIASVKEHKDHFY